MHRSIQPKFGTLMSHWVEPRTTGGTGELKWKCSTNCDLFMYFTGPLISAATADRLYTTGSASAELDFTLTHFAHRFTSFLQGEGQKKSKIWPSPYHSHLLSHKPVRHLCRHHFHRPSLLISSTASPKLIFSINHFLHSYSTLSPIGLTPRTPTVFFSLFSRGRPFVFGSVYYVKSELITHSLTHSFILSFISSFLPSFLPSVIHSFIHSFIDSFIHSFVRSFVHSFTHLLTHSLIHLFIHSFIHWFIHSFVRSFVRSFIHSLTHSLIHSFIYSFIHHSFVRLLTALSDRRWWTYATTSR